MPPATDNPTPTDDSRFVTPRWTLLVDRVMTAFIKTGGIGIIIAVFGIFLFILWQILPLFRSAAVEQVSELTLPIPSAQVAAVGLDEWGQDPVVIARDGTVRFLPIGTGSEKSQVFAPELKQRTVQSLRWDSRHARLALGCNDGSLLVSKIAWNMTFSGSGATRTSAIAGSVTPVLDVSLSDESKPIRAVAFSSHEDRHLAVAVLGDANKPSVISVSFAEKGGLIGGKTLAVDNRQDLSAQIVGVANNVLVDERGDSAVVSTVDGRVYYFQRVEDHLELRQAAFKPFEDAAKPQIASMDWLLGDVSLVFTNPDGLNRQYSLFLRKGSEVRQFGLTKQFPDLPAGASSYAVSTRNKCFLVSAGQEFSIRHGTSATERAAITTPYTPVAVALSGKYHRIATAGSDDKLHLYSLHDPHPEAGFKALFGKVWYEGKSEPTYDWQSTGGSDDFEPKLSMVPLIWGTLKATFYAMLIAVPIALLGAVYTAEFMHPDFKRIIKPTVEVMASLPSVVLGFLAALWLAPLIEDRIPSILMVLILLPTVAMLSGWWWSGLSMRWRSLIKPGYEYLAFIPLLLLTIVGAWSLGPALERLIFWVPGHDGQPLADFRLWWSQTTGMSFEQRNSLVVGLMMGFAVIPIIFTIAEDALSNVPKALRSGSLALGASRWQTAFRVVLPTASAGIFSALMIGLGRAIGETMIVVMATGNTPIMTMNIFDGIRTLSANIAVELSEAPVEGTLFRTLFLGAFLLFMLTFIVNTGAEVLRQHLREKYKTV